MLRHCWNNKPMSDLKNPDFQLQTSKLLLVFCPVSFLHSELSHTGSTPCLFREVHSRSLFLYCFPVRCGIICLSATTSKINFQKEEAVYFHCIRRWGWNSQKVAESTPTLECVCPSGYRPCEVWCFKTFAGRVPACFCRSQREHIHTAVSPFPPASMVFHIACPAQRKDLPKVLTPRSPTNPSTWKRTTAAV